MALQRSWAQITHAWRSTATRTNYKAAALAQLGMAGRVRPTEFIDNVLAHRRPHELPARSLQRAVQELLAEVSTQRPNIEPPEPSK